MAASKLVDRKGRGIMIIDQRHQILCIKSSIFSIYFPPFSGEFPAKLKFHSQASLRIINNLFLFSSLQAALSFVRNCSDYKRKMKTLKPRFLFKITKDGTKCVYIPFLLRNLEPDTHSNWENISFQKVFDSNKTCESFSYS